LACFCFFEAFFFAEVAGFFFGDLGGAFFSAFFSLPAAAFFCPVVGPLGDALHPKNSLDAP
jgi:hypothetical protein